MLDSGTSYAQLVVGILFIYNKKILVYIKIFYMCIDIYGDISSPVDCEYIDIYYSMGFLEKKFLFWWGG